MADSQFQVIYDYADVPTLKRFALSNARFRSAMGPFGCLSCDTEYLTLSGWRRMDEYSPEDSIAEFDLETSRAIFRKPLGYIKEPCDSFLHLKNRYGIDQLLSDEHAVLYNTRFKPTEWRTTFAGDLAEQHNNLRDGWSGRIPTVFGAPDSPGIDFTDSETRLMVAISADGHFPENRSGTYCTICVRKQRKKDRLRLLLNQCGIEWRERNYPARPMETSFDFLAPEKNKLLWKYIDANEHQLSIIADEFVHWDGCADCYGGRIFSSTIKENADFIQYVLATTGVRATVVEVDHENEKWKTGYRVYANTGATFLSLRQAPKIGRAPSPDGYKYCFKTCSGFFIARRNGRIFITGNSGKSSACVMEIIRRAKEQKPGPDGIRRSRWAVIRNTYNQLKDTTIKTFHDWYPPKVFGEWRVTDHTYIITAFPGIQLEVIFRALDRPDQVSNLLSLEVTGAWFNEVREISPTIIEAMDGRIARYPSKRDGGASWAGIIMDTNPPEEGSYLYNMQEIKRPDNWEVFKQPSGLSSRAENLRNLPKNYYQNLSKGKSDNYIRVYVHGEYGYTRVGKPVFSSYKDNVHVSSRILQPLPGLPLLTGWDFGLTPCVVIGQLPPGLGQLRIIDELVSQDMGLKQFCINQFLPFINQKYFGYHIEGFGDPAGVSRVQTDEQTCFEILHSAEICLPDIVPAPTNAMVPRIGAVESLLNRMNYGEPCFVISSHCRHLRKAMASGYAYPQDPKDPEEHKMMPIKNFSSHIADALQMLCMYVEDTESAQKRAANLEEQLRKSQAYETPAATMAGY